MIMMGVLLFNTVFGVSQDHETLFVLEYEVTLVQILYEPSAMYCLSMEAHLLFIASDWHFLTAISAAAGLRDLPVLQRDHLSWAPDSL